jgi:hypothetical protein
MPAPEIGLRIRKRCFGSPPYGLLTVDHEIFVFSTEIIAPSTGPGRISSRKGP